MKSESKICLVTGGGGYLGKEVGDYLRNAGWQVRSTVHGPAEGKDEISYSLGDDLPPSALDSVNALVHCAYDFRPRTWKGIYGKNVLGTRHLLQQAAKSGIKNIVTISSISAFPGCRSLYGRAKLLVEDETHAVGGVSLRPGLIYGGRDRGMYGRLEDQVRRGRPIPLLSGSPCTQYLIHVEDLCRVIEALLFGVIPPPRSAWIVAHPDPWPLRDLLTRIAGDRKLRFIPIPWPVIWAALRLAEAAGFRLNFKSDSVVSIVNQNPQPDFQPILACGVSMRPFSPSAAEG
jgi:nucleoside-diphosphate-sugar epimerase